MRLVKLARKYAAAIVFVLAIAILAAIAGTGGGPMINAAFGYVVAGLEAVLYATIPGLQMPLVVFVLFAGALFFTVRFRFINFRAFKHGIDVLLGRYDDPDDPGDVSHFQALSSALSATVGLGNIAGVAIAVSMGGPGAVFWMMVVALFGMSSKFAECTLGQMYRQVDSAGEMRGGPMVYLREGLRDRDVAGLNLEKLGIGLSVLFAILCIGTSIGAGNMFQTNQSFSALSERVEWLGGTPAEGTVTLQADQPVRIEKGTHQLRFVAPPRSGGDEESEDVLAAIREGDSQTIESLGNADLLGYVPEANADKDRLVLARDDWRRSGDHYEVDVSVHSEKNGIRYNVRPGSVSALLEAKLAENQRQISSWKLHPDIREATNGAAIEGAQNPRGWVYGLILAFLVGMVIIGGIKSIARVAEKIVPAMCAIYILAGLFVIYLNIEQLGPAVATILSEAFSPQAMGVGGFIGVFVQGVRRAAFSSEAGIGSAPIAHSAAKTEEPVREGVVAMLGPFIDTIVVCFITGIVIVISGVYAQPSTAGLEGVTLTAAAFGSELDWFPWVLSIAVVLFAFSTMISWSYYGERCWTYLFGDDQAMAFRFIFVFFVLLGSVSSLDNVLSFGDYFLLAMAFPNILGVVLLSDEIDEKLRDYWDRYTNGDMQTFD